MTKEFGSGVGMVNAPVAAAGRASGTFAGSPVSRAAESGFSHTIPAPARAPEAAIKAPTITHKFGAENTRNITLGKPISQDTFRGNESIQGLKIIAKNNGEPAKKPPQSGKFNNGAENLANKHEIQPRSQRQELSRTYSKIKPNPSYFQPDSFKGGEVKGLETSYKGNTKQGIGGNNKALEQSSLPKASVAQEAQRLSKITQEQGVRVDIEQITKQSQEQQIEGTNPTTKYTENSRSLMEDYISEYVKPNAMAKESNTPSASLHQNTITQTEQISRNEGKIKRDGKIAAREFNKDVEQAKRVSEAFDAYLQSVGSTNPALQEEGRRLSLRSLDQQLQRNGVKEAVMTAYTAGREKNTTQFEDIADLLEQPQRVDVEEAVVKTELQTSSPLLQADELSEESLRNDSEEQHDTQQEVETEFAEEISHQDVLDEGEEPEYVLERDEKANEMRKAYAMFAAQTIFSANGQQSVSGPQIVSLMPNDDLQPQEVKSQIIQELLRDDGSYKDVLSVISSALDMETLHEVKSVVDSAVENNTAVKVVEIEQKSAPEATEQEKEKVLDESVRPIRKTHRQARSSY